MPSGKAIFFSIISAFCTPCPELEGCSTPISVPELRACLATIDLDHPADLEVLFDGFALESPDAYRTATPRFSWSAPADPDDQYIECMGPVPMNRCGIPTGNRYSIVDGHFVMLGPRPRDVIRCGSGRR